MRRGNSLIAVVLMLLVASFLATAMLHMTKWSSQSEVNIQMVLTDYHTMAVHDVIVLDFVVRLGSYQVTQPKTPLNQSAFVYEEAIAYIPSDDFEGFLRERMETLDNERIKKYLPGGANLVLNAGKLQCDFQNENNILQFSTGDKLYLEPLSLSVYTKEKGHSKQTDYEISNLFCTIDHSDTEFKLTINNDEMTVERVMR